MNNFIFLGKQLPNIKERENVLSAFIPWSVPAQILYKEDGTEN